VSELEDLTARLQLLEDERAVLATLYRYGHALDYGAEADWLDCFTPDATYELRYPPGVAIIGRPTTYRGHDALAAFVANHSRAPDRYHKHLLVEPVITLDGDLATGTSYFVRIDDDEGERVLYAFGRYLDELARGADRRWRFTSRVAEIESRRSAGAPRRG
jgi:hypothetical protein